MKYAVIMYIHTDNIGDDIQSYAALKYLPKVDYIIDREEINSFNSKYKVKGILNGWFLYNNINWPPSQNLDLLPISLHIATNFFKNEYEKILFEYRTKKYFKNFSIIGCRDVSTSNYLSQLNINNYISNCLTLTIDKFKIESPKEKYICAVDLSHDEYNKLKSMTNIKIKKMTHDFRGKNLDFLSFDERMRQVEDFLKIYQNALCVVTTRYHVAMPCVALETPVILIPSQFEPSRYDGLKNIVYIISKEKFLSNDFSYDFNNPIKNKDPKKIRRELENKCYDFINNNQFKTINYQEDELENSYSKLLKDLENKSQELNHRDRVNYYTQLDFDRYVKRNITN